MQNRLIIYATLVAYPMVYFFFKFYTSFWKMQIHINLLLMRSATVRPPRRFYEFRTRVMREIAGEGLKFTENPCETHARAMRNPCEVSRGSRSSRKSAKFARGFLQFPRMMDIFSIDDRSTLYCLSLWLKEKNIACHSDWKKRKEQLWGTIKEISLPLNYLPITPYYVAFKKTDTFEMQANCAH